MAEQRIGGAEAGKHGLCEKPMARDAAECDRMIGACRASGVRLGIAYYRRFYPVVRRIGEILESGEIGEPVWAQMTAFEAFNPGPGSPRAWLVQRSSSGRAPTAELGPPRPPV